MATYVVSDGQSVADVALELFGDVLGVFTLLDENPGVFGIADRLLTGQQLNYGGTVINRRVKAYLADFAPIATISEEDKPSGIGFWRLDEYIVG